MAHAEKIPPVEPPASLASQVPPVYALHRLPRQCAKAILWVAANDACADVPDAEALSGFATVAMIADVWKLSAEKIGETVYRIRGGKAAAVSALNTAIAKAAEARVS